ncbi:hypothetical protein [Neorickettsia sp. 179522]|uniref:hypothetical protein n=1 Tax=Neorickettsia sp. 179522 TaxID=1714371 RepID=UPI00079AF55F|nr:hypothetical protein [Neorickettsia sp. 179522]KYH12280.1 hypothetical protein AS219_00400 [Neorickettsia sp. 179522]
MDKNLTIALVVVAGMLGLLLLLNILCCFRWLCRRRAALRAAEEEERAQLLPEESPLPRLEEVKVGTLAALEGCFSTDGLLGPPGPARPRWDTDVVIVDPNPDVLISRKYSRYCLYAGLGIAGTWICRSKEITIDDVQVFCGPRGRTAEGRSWMIVHAVYSKFDHSSKEEGIKAVLQTMSEVLSSEEFAEYVNEEMQRFLGPGHVPTIFLEPPLSARTVLPWFRQIRHFAKCLASQPGVEERGILPLINAPVNVCCGYEVLRAAALEGVRDAVRERSQDAPLQDARGL